MNEEKKKYVFRGVQCQIGTTSYSAGDVAEFTDDEYRAALEGRAAFVPLDESPKGD